MINHAEHKTVILPYGPGGTQQMRYEVVHEGEEPHTTLILRGNQALTKDVLGMVKDHAKAIRKVIEKEGVSKVAEPLVIESKEARMGAIQAQTEVVMQTGRFPLKGKLVELTTRKKVETEIRAEAFERAEQFEDHLRALAEK